jgi:hypothetical protein
VLAVGQLNARLGGEAIEQQLTIFHFHKVSSWPFDSRLSTTRTICIKFTHSMGFSAGSTEGSWQHICHFD